MGHFLFPNVKEISRFLIQIENDDYIFKKIEIDLMSQN